MTEQKLYATEPVLALHRRSFVFDCLTLGYVLDEPYVARMLEGGVNAINVTVAAEGESWDETLRRTDGYLNKISRNPNLVHATRARI